MILQAMPVFQHQQPIFVDRSGFDDAVGRRLSARESDEQAIVEQRRLVHVAAGKRDSEQHAVELAAMERVAGRLARLFTQEQLQVRPLLAQARKHRRKQEGRDGRDDAHAQFAVERLALGARHVGQFLALAKDAQSLFRDLLA